MTDLRHKYGTTALVAGASEGIGAAFAEALASEGMDLVLVARRRQPLETLAAGIERKFKTGVICIPCDLAEEDALDKISGALSGREIDLLVYNAALSFLGPFIERDQEDNLKMTRVNMITPLKMVSYFGGGMLERKRGAIILMTSLAGFQGSGYLALYASTKAFLRVLAESLWYEWKEQHVDALACCAGATSTPGYVRSQPEKAGIFAPRVLSPGEVTAECLVRLGRQPSFITGRGNRIASFIMQKLLPRRMAVTIMGNTTRKLFRF
jgi:short-subunit dehydrogenase